MTNRSVHPRRCQRISGGRRILDSRLTLVLALFVLSMITVWSYRSIAAGLLHGWRNNDDYSAGQLIPLVAFFLVWRDRKALGECLTAPCWGAGAILLLLAEAARAYGFIFMRPVAESYSLVLSVAGLVLMVAGWQVFRRMLWILLFMFLMFPLPGVVHNMISGPLQSVATMGSVFLLEACGTSVGRQGNIVVLNGETPLAVAEACSGLRMLIAFVIAAALIAYLVKRPRWQKAVLLVSSIPVAVICNVIRIFITALLMMYVGSEVGQKFFHDIGGFVMIAVAVSLLFGEIRLMDRLIVSESSPQPRQVIVSARAPARGQA